MKRALVSALAGLLPLVAVSHTGDAAHGHDFITGFFHPLSGADHLAAMLTVGLWSGLALRRPWQAPLAFAVLLLVGALLGLSGLELPAVEPMIAASVLAPGSAGRHPACPGARPGHGPGGLFLPVSTAWAHGAELEGGLALLGMVLATWLLHVAGLGLGLWLRRTQARWALAVEPRAGWRHCAAGPGPDVPGGRRMIPGELFTPEGEHLLNPGRRTLSLVVQNAGDRPIQVGSHYHFAETNAALQFDRAAARGMRLNIGSGLAMRFEPGQQRTVELVDLAGARIVHGFRGLVQGSL